jgi:dimethylamine monooxygenase subunit B
VAQVRQITPQIKHFKLVACSGAELPPFSAGSHIIVVMAGADRTYRNPYSLLGSPLQLDQYEIAVRRMDESRGGSHFMHDVVKEGSLLDIAHPVNLFPLNKLARKHLFVAGGIGITPIMAQLVELHSGQVPYELHYAVRGPEHAAFLPELQAREPGRVQAYYESIQQRIPFDGLLSNQPLGTHLYVCGPPGMISVAVESARVWGWPESHIHWEQFSAPPIGEGFEVYLSRSQRRVHVAPDQSLLEAIEASGVEVPYLCRGGVCGACRTEVEFVDGELVHNDYFLSDEEKSSGKAIMPCVSRARCKQLVLNR